jgi:NMD protein affecting ribosome stability and mRNA decay
VLCQVCGALLQRRRWQRPGAVKATSDLLARAAWQTCPACEQQRKEEYLGRIVVRGTLLASAGSAIKRRIQNVAKRAEFSNVQHRIVSIEERNGAVEILTTSQKLAHRIASELTKAFGGRAMYTWLDDGCLEARWRMPAPAARKA